MAKLLDGWGPQAAGWIERALFPRESIGPLPLLLLAVTLVAYWPALHAGFVRWDEQLYVTENPFLSDPNGLLKSWTTLRETERQYYPLLLTTYWFEHRLWGDVPSGYHAVNIWLHLCNSLLVLLLLTRLGAGRWAAGVGASLFALHPIQVESVVWVAEMKNLQMGLFYLAAFLLYLYHRSAEDRGSSAKAWTAYGGVLLLYACALLSKTAAITLPLSLFLADWLLVAPRDRRWWKGSLLRVAPMLAMGIAPSLITISLEDGPAPASIPPLALRPFVASAALWFYLGKLLAPVSLTPIYPRWNLPAIRFWLLLAAAGVGAVGILWWRLRHRVPRLAVWGAGHFLATLLPMLGLIPFGYLDYSFVADHFVYLACIGLFAAAAVGVDRVAGGTATKGGARGGRWLATGLVCLVLAGCLIAVRVQITVWHDQITFWSYVAEKNPRSAAVQNNLGNAYLRQKRFDEAIDRYRIALRISPDDSLAHVNLGMALELQGHDRPAIEEYRLAVTHDPSGWPAYYQLALTYARLERFEEAIDAAERAITFARPLGRSREVDELTRLVQSCREKLSKRPVRP